MNDNWRITLVDLAIGFAAGVVCGIMLGALLIVAVIFAN